MRNRLIGDGSAVTRVAMTALLVLSGFAASASTVGLNGSGQMYWTGQFLGSAGGNTTTSAPSGYGNTYTLGVPGQYGFFDQFNAPQNSPLVDSSGTPFESSGSPVGTYSFQDSYQFTLTAPASGDILAVSLALQGISSSLYNISDLQFRLYEVPSAGGPYGPALSIPAGSTVVTSWQGKSGNDNGVAISANFGNVQSGTYFLDISGTPDGTSGGTYVGQLNLSPVPLPPALPLLLSGIVGFGVMSRRRKAAAV